MIIERFLSETINSRPHVADILTPFLHTSPNTGKPAFFSGKTWRKLTAFMKALFM